MKNKKTPKRDVTLCKLGENIRRIRREKGLSQESLALVAGLDRSYVGGVERGERNIAVINLKKLAKAIGVGVSELVKGV
jgi:transcriptional regulator with XRE-family HTH domain